VGLLCPPFNDTDQNCGAMGPCVTCPTGTHCQNFTCVPALPDGGLCRNLGPQFATDVGAISFDPIDGGPLTLEGASWSFANPDPSFDFFQVELNPQLVPGAGASHVFGSGDSFFTCPMCVYLLSHCVGTQCDRLYFAQGGGMTAVAVGRDFHSGFMSASGASLHLVEWSAATDQPVAGGGCVDVPFFEYRAQYQYVGNVGGRPWVFDAG
jgi:hypothetical protein